MSTLIDSEVAALAETLSAVLLKLSQDGPVRDLRAALEDLSVAVDDCLVATCEDPDENVFMGWSGPLTQVPDSLQGWEEQ